MSCVPEESYDHIDNREGVHHMKKTILTILLIVAYVFITIFGFFSGMFSEPLIGSTHPMAAMLADVIVWFDVVVSLSPAACLLTSGFLREKPIIQRIVLALPFILMTVQLLLGYIADIVIIPHILITKPCSAP